MYFGILSHESLLIMYFGMPPSCSLSLLLYSVCEDNWDFSITLHGLGPLSSQFYAHVILSFLFSSLVALTYPSQQFRPNSCLLILNLTLFFKLFTLNNHAFFLNNENATVDLDQSLFEESEEEVDLLCQWRKALWTVKMSCFYLILDRVHS